MWRSRRNPRFSTTENGLISAAMKTQMSLVIAVALALDGGRDATAFRVVCPFNVCHMRLVLVESCGGSVCVFA